MTNRKKGDIKSKIEAFILNRRNGEGGPDRELYTSDGGRDSATMISTKTKFLAYFLMRGAIASVNGTGVRGERAMRRKGRFLEKSKSRKGMGLRF